MRLITLRSLAIALLVTLGGCGPIEYISVVTTRASRAVSSAEAAEGARCAPYEYTAAEAYLHKAREEAGYAEYQDSIEYGHKAEEMAHRARAIAMNRLGQPSSAGASSSGGTIEPPPPPPARPRKAKAKPAPKVPGPAGMDEDPPSADAPPARPTSQ